MGELLVTRADMLAIQITYNSLHTEAMSRSSSRTSRASLFPSFGRLYPGGSELLSRVEDEDGLRRAIGKAAPEYGTLWDAAPVDAVSGGAAARARAVAVDRAR
jgi:V-type H+-transporting ATPase subunit d